MLETYAYSGEPIILAPCDMEKDEWAFICKILGMNAETCKMIILSKYEGFFVKKEKEKKRTCETCKYRFSLRCGLCDDYSQWEPKY